MTNEEIKYCVEVHKKVVMTQVLDTKKLRKAANLIRGVEPETLSNPSLDRQTIYSWYVRHGEAFLAELEDMFNDVDKTDTNTPAVTPPKEEQSHSEDLDIAKSEMFPPENQYVSAKSEMFPPENQSHTEEVDGTPQDEDLDDTDETVALDNNYTQEEKEGIYLADAVNAAANLFDADPTPENKKALKIARMRQTKWVNKNA